MSLFKAREWWHTQCGSNEEFDGGGLCVLSLSQDDQDAGGIIFTGSLQGMLRAYQPRQKGFKPEDLLYEQELEQAVLQLKVGRFSSAGGLQLAVLHPKMLTVFAIQPLSTHLQVTRLYEHHMDHTAANMCYGEFGGAKGVDHICVQSYDGQLSFFECELFTFARYLPNFLIPGPIAYVASSDVIVTANAGLQLEAYRYKSLAAASAQKPGGSDTDHNLLDQEHLQPAGSGRYNSVLATSAKSAGLAVGKKVTADWRTVLGETAIEIHAGKLSAGLGASGADIVVLCEHHVFVISSIAGSIMLQRRLEYHPAAACLLPVQAADGGEAAAHNLLVATHNQSLAVYHGHRHVWAAKLNQQPVSVQAATLGHPPLQGLLVCLDQDGAVSVNYMGTEPMNHTIAVTQSTTHDYGAIAREQRALTRMIQEHGQEGTVSVATEQLSIKVHIPSTFDQVRGSRGAAGMLSSSPSRRLQPIGSTSSSMHAGVQTLTMRLLLTCKDCPAGLDDVSVFVSMPPGVTSEQDSWVVEHIGNDMADPAVVNIPLSAASQGSLLPTSRHLHYVVTYQLPGTREHHVQLAEVPLPFCLFASLVPPVKNAVYRVTVSTNKDAPLLTDIFTDMTAQATSATMQAYESAGANVLTFHVAGIADVTVLVSKSAGRYRLQSDSIEVMWLILAELMQRLEAYYGAEQHTTQQAATMTPAAKSSHDPAGGGEAQDDRLQWSSQELLPLQDVQEAVDAHWSCRQQYRQLRLTLQQRAAALRVIQKRLLMRFKDQHPAPLSQLDTLLEETYASLQETAAQLEQSQAAVRQAAAKLSGILQLLLLLCRIKFNMLPSELVLLGGAVCVDVVKLEEGVLNQPANSSTTTTDDDASSAGDVGWEEHAEASLTQLLRTCLARNSKEAAAALPDTMQPAQDAQKVKRLLGLVLERLSKGQRLLPDTDTDHVMMQPAARGE